MADADAIPDCRLGKKFGKISRAMGDDDKPELNDLDPVALLAQALERRRPPLDARLWKLPTPEELAILLPFCHVEKRIEPGGNMGAVYKGFHIRLDRPVAIKLLPMELAADGEFVARFEREARILARLNHPGIVDIYESDQTEQGHLFFVMEYVDGPRLRDVLRGPGLKPEEVLTMVEELCEALQAAHEEKIVHRDIKPENVLLTRRLKVKLADFGVSYSPREGSVALTRTNLVLGTSQYMAPELRTGAALADARSDIFSLGVMFYEMLTGQLPQGKFARPSRLRPMDRRIDAVVLKALEYEPKHRYQEVSELKAAVKRIRERPGGWWYRRMIVIAALLLVLVGSWWWYFGKLAKQPGAGPTVEVKPAVGQSKTSAPASPPPRIPVRVAGPVSEEKLTGSAWLLAFDDGGRPEMVLHFEKGKKAIVEHKNQRSTVGTWSVRSEGTKTMVHLSGADWDVRDADLWFDDALTKLSFSEFPSGTARRLSEAEQGIVPAAVQSAFVGHDWDWANEGDSGPPQVVQFRPDNRVSGGWEWKWERKDNGQLMATCYWGPGHMYLVLNADTTAFEGYDRNGKLVVKGQRLRANNLHVGIGFAHNFATRAGSAPAAQETPRSSPPATVPTLAAAEPSPLNKPPGLEAALLGYKWAWTDLKGDSPTITVQFFPNGIVSGGWRWQWLRKPDGEVIVDCLWGDEHMYLAFNESRTEFGAYGGKGAKGRRLEAIGTPTPAERR